MTAHEIAERFNAKRSGNGWMAKCPAHDDSKPSLSISDGDDGRTLLKCHGKGCSFESILAAANLKPADCFPEKPRNVTPTPRRIVARYPYTDAGGKLLFEAVRYEPKDFRQRQPDGAGGWKWNLQGVEPVLFRLPEIRKAIAEGVPVFICEGEKDALALVANRFEGTCNPMGAGKWRDAFNATLAGADVVVIPDNDTTGRAHAAKVCASLHGKAASVRLVTLPESLNGQRVKDAADYFNAGGNNESLLALCEAAPEWAADTGFAESLVVVTSELPPVKKQVAVTSEPPLSDLPENATELEFADALQDLLPPLKTVDKDWFAYQVGAWSPISRATLRPKAQAVLPPTIRTARRESTLIDHLEGRLQVSPDAFRGFNRFTDDGGVLVNAGNGIVAVRPDSMELLPHEPAELFTAKTAAHFNQDAKAELFERVLCEALPDSDDVKLFQLCTGNMLMPDCRFEVAVAAYGEAGTSKSTVCEQPAIALGGSLVQRLTMQQVCDSRSYHLPKLKFAAVNLGTELDAVQIDESGMFKCIVSGEPVEARPIYGAPFTMQTACKLWFLANGLPRFKHGTEAELRRTRFLRFARKPEQKDVTLKSRLAAERDGVFMFMLAGLQELLTLREIPLGGVESRAVHERFKVSNDPLGSFTAQFCQFDAEGYTTKDNLKAAFNSFCETHGLPVEFDTWFFKRLYERWPNLTEAQPRRGTERVRVVRGITLKNYVE